MIAQWFILWSINLHNRPVDLFAMLYHMASVKTVVALVSCLLLLLSAWGFYAARYVLNWYLLHHAVSQPKIFEGEKFR